MPRRNDSGPASLRYGCGVSALVLGAILFYGIFAFLANPLGISRDSFWLFLLCAILFPGIIAVTLFVIYRERERSLRARVSILGRVSTRLRRRGRLRSVNRIERVLSKRERELVSLAGELPPTDGHSRYIPNELRLKVLDRDGYCCRMCGKTWDLEIDHIIPFSRGGRTVYRNLQVLCGPCNRRKYNKIPG